jgi:hypothetical protein
VEGVSKTAFMGMFMLVFIVGFLFFGMGLTFLLFGLFSKGSKKAKKGFIIAGSIILGFAVLATLFLIMVFFVPWGM